MITIILFIGIVFIATLIQGITGFGWAIIAGPLALYLLDKETYIISSMVISFVLNGFLLYKIKAEVDKESIKTLLFMTLLGIPVGIYMLKLAPIADLRIFAGFLSLIFTLVLFFQKQFIIDKNKGAFIGFLAGILNTSVNMSGPLLALYFASRKLPRDVMRKSLVTIFFTLSIVTLPLLVASVNFDFSKMIPGLAAVIPTLIAGYVGNKIASLIPAGTFRKYTLIFVFIISTCVVLNNILHR